MVLLHYMSSAVKINFIDFLKNIKKIFLKLKHCVELPIKSGIGITYKLVKK